ncbi:phenylalanyl-tRNA synthetase, beta subunit [Caldisphaera lagunensis DSM 15908]|uniref:Phenylalanine--tRNA ligase beta subunit n=1 Tax=Caldisphaera lagunensis (strain DSM 15908 / JCM 11604 / ANMR 0165 / IC-154) TaxID=1056495 RepID=L0A8B0_CALLD|nr:phenylalanine--tRNA ligase subunit beta [Caldisphaera lagunensis]AFZ70076.1 phenylalanyl-tRNA synthetase, beta subunit [Caldisphaera lagunensis DSM 15908]
MPVLKFNPNRILKLTGLDMNSLRELLFSLKCETNINEQNQLEVEINPDRPDMYIGEGIARAVKGLSNKEKGFKNYYIENTSFELINEEPISRPIISAAILYNVKLDDEFLIELIQFQEKLHEGIGRKRKKVAIGIHDLSKIPSNKLIYKDVPIDTKMIPLNSNDYKTIEEVLKETEQGIKYGDISLLNNKHPAIISGNEIISLPPVINSNITRLEEKTKDLFIDVTGTDFYYVNKTMDIIVSNLAERDDVKIGRVKIINKKETKITPLMSKEEIIINKNYVNNVLGEKLSENEIADHLLRMRYNVEISEEKLKVIIPPFRADIISEVDLIEDIAMSIGYNNIIPNRPKIMLKGSLMDVTMLKRKIRDIMIGLGFTEIQSLTLVSLKNLVDLKERNYIEVLNPVTADFNSLRPNLFISIIQAMKNNVKSSKPIKIFEIGKVVEKIDNIPIDKEKLGIAIMDESLSYENMQSIVYALLKLLNIEFKINESTSKYLIKGRSADIIVNNKIIGSFGEVSPYILEKFNLDYPIVYAEIEIG